MHRRVVAAAVVLLLAGLGSAAVAASGGGAGPDAPSDARSATAVDAGPLLQTTPDGFDTTVFRVRVFENGSARWTHRYVRLLDNESEVETFEAYAADFKADEPAFVDAFRTRAERLTAFGSNATGREMRAVAFTDAAFTQPTPGGATAVGVVELSFRWEAFAPTSGDSVVVSDVFESGMYVGPSQRLVFAPGPGLRFATDGVSPIPDLLGGPNLTASDRVIWTGERQFGDRRPSVRFVADDAADPSGSGSDGATDADAGGLPWTLLSLVVGVALVVGLGGLALYGSTARSDPGAGAAGTEAPAAGAKPGETTADDATGAEDAGAEPQPPSEPAVPEEELLSDEDRVVQLLEENGGRMKQVNIVDETEWSKSKVSMLLSEMEEDGDISKLRVGRENIISLAGNEPDAAGSPFDEED